MIPNAATLRCPPLAVRLLLATLGTLIATTPARAGDEHLARLQPAFEQQVRPLLKQHCFECHSAELAEAEVDLEAFSTTASMRPKLRTWQRVAEILDSGQMPPKDAPQPTDADRAAIQAWLKAFLTAEAAASAGDPGRVVLRRLNNAEYTYTLRDLTGVATLDPAREFPVDSAAGEGFTNTGSTLVMSPAMVTKYLDAGKAVAAHAVLVPDGFRFSPSTSRRDWTEELLAQIRGFYARYADTGGGTRVNLQGIQFDTNQGGLLPVERYLAATLTARDDLTAGRKSPATVAREQGLNAKYLGQLWDALGPQPGERSLAVERLRSRWRQAQPADAAAMAGEIAGWHQALWKFNSIGHIGRHLGREDGPAVWMEPVTPLVARQELRVKLEPKPGEPDLTLYLSASDAGDGPEHDAVIWENPRLVAPGRPDLPLRDLRSLVAVLEAQRGQIAATAARCLAAAAEAGATADDVDAGALAQKHQVDPAILRAWLEYLGVGAEAARLDGYLTQKSLKTESYDFVQGWVGADALSVMANASDQHVRIPGNLKPHSVAVHPAPNRSVVLGWRSPVNGPLAVRGVVQHAHPECGNGVSFDLELRRGSTRQRLAGGVAQGGTPVPIAPMTGLAIRKGDLITLVIGPRDGNHSCDLTAVDLTLEADGKTWDLARDVSPSILAGNPHADGLGNAEVWHFASEPPRGGPQSTIPAGSVLARWRAAATDADRTPLAAELQRLLSELPANLPAADAPDAVLRRQLTALSGPLLSSLRTAALEQAARAPGTESPYGLATTRFGVHPDGSPIDPRSLCVQAPSLIALKLPADLVEGCEFVASGVLHPAGQGQGSVQLQAGLTPPGSTDLTPGVPVLVGETGPARQRFEAAFDDLRRLFPPALCYTRIVPVDEVVTLNLYYREDDALKRLMLDEAECAEIDRLWDELLYVAQEPLQLAGAFEQLYEYATQDAPQMVKAFGPMRKPVNDRAAAFRQRLVATEPVQLDHLLAFADRAYRRPLTAAESQQIRDLYANLRATEIPHDEALRLTLARILVAPAFLYKLEHPAPGSAARPVSDAELASRLSYFLWSSLPDAELRQVADSGQLQRPEVLRAQLARMLADPKAARLASEFGAQWLHIQGFENLDEKSERHFPTFTALRGAMSEESLRFLTDLIQQDRPVLNLLDADYTFLNEELAAHYGIPGVAGPEWRRVEGVKPYGRGGVLGQATTLAKQSGASRTSPILRGNWLSEVILGEKLPRPPKNVPPLAETVPDDLTERQLTERHSSDPSCAKCHIRIDPFGYALENYDAIGRFRTQDAAGHPINARTRLQDGTELDGFEGLRSYLVQHRRDAFVRQFHRKLLGYALGRAVQLSDEPLLDTLQPTVDGREPGVQRAIEAIVLSPQFRSIRGRDQAAEAE